MTAQREEGKGGGAGIDGGKGGGAREEKGRREREEQIRSGKRADGKGRTGELLSLRGEGQIDDEKCLR